MTPEEINSKALELAIKQYLVRYKYDKSKLEDDAEPGIIWMAKQYREFILDTSWAKKEEKESNVKDENGCIMMADLPICKECNEPLTIVAKQAGWGKCTICNSIMFQNAP